MVFLAPETGTNHFPCPVSSFCAQAEHWSLLDNNRICICASPIKILNELISSLRILFRVGRGAEDVSAL